MKLKSGFELRDVCGEKVVIAQGIENVDFSKLITLNESAAYLWTAVGTGSFDAHTLARLLVEEYEVTPEKALSDADTLIEVWRKQGVIEE
ncbi:hypothetical protein IMSAGC014_01642 [Bacteroidaceae bacterium]|uniref:PqqD family protein n=1 Tax=Prevotella sp. MGM2 TaxID=2033406 RepID=UPI000CE9BDB0|nr:PqqD family protein [Prevotella sp. MGM2]GAY29300.1 PqqD family protein [Prevotella sp. MGM2]GFI35131.1 hypothetical protein IMSAGC014_01642 [Bacteroidaceae bacterium]